MLSANVSTKLAPQCFIFYVELSVVMAGLRFTRVITTTHIDFSKKPHTSLFVCLSENLLNGYEIFAFLTC